MKKLTRKQKQFARRSRVAAIVGLLLLLTYAVGHCEECKQIEYQEDIVIQCENSFSNISKKSVSDLDADKAAYVQRSSEQAALVQAELYRKHTLDVEAAKFTSAVLLQRAGAANVSVSAVALNTNHNTTTQENKNA